MLLRDIQCISRNVIYLGTCTLCNKGYVGKTANFLRSRINGHRALYYKIILHNGDLNAFTNERNNDYNNDLSLAFHLFKAHNCDQRSDFNKFYNFTIIHHCSPDTLYSSEHKWIHRLRTLEPGGINSHNRFSIQVL